MGLREYKRKRHFERTPEPAGKVRRAAGRSFVIQKHAASHLHYDFRLELDGVLKSWAVPKGPSLDPAVKRLAMQVEDHPVEYGSFEGTIPEGQYGAGTVMLWDHGDWELVGDAHAGYRDGRLKFVLHGQKLHGGWMLVRTGDHQRVNGDKRSWLLFKERDNYAQASDRGDVLSEMPRSVTTGRDLDEIAEGRDSVWHSHKNAKRATTAKRTVKSSSSSSNGRHRTLQPKSKSQEAPDLHGYDARKKQFAGVRLTSPTKVLYPDQGITKLELASYYLAVADWMLPHVKNRPLVLVRCPEGRHKECFYQKHPPAGTPDTLRQIKVREKTTTEPYVVVDDRAGLISLAQIGSLEIHAWGAKEDNLERPDRLVFDLDPDPAVAWRSVIQSAFQIRQFLGDLGLEAFLKTTGGKGLHLVVPIERRHEWEEVTDFCKLLADTIVTADPQRYTANMSKAARPGKIFIDYLRNNRGATAVAPYSTRAKPGAPISTPITWKELEAGVRSDQYTIRNIARRLSELKRDPWEEIDVRQRLGPAMDRLTSLSRR